MAPAFICRTSIVGVAVASAMALFAGTAFADHNPVDGYGFDMDGNLGNADGSSQSNANNEGVDWQDLIDGTIQPGDPDGSGHCTFVNGEVITEAPDTSVAWKGATKDFNLLSEWWIRDSSASSKSDIINAMTASWLCTVPGDPNPHLFMQFAADRASTNGTTFVGFWALQNETFISGNRLDTSGGDHLVGDILTVTDFQGSIAPGDTVNESLAVYEWDPVTNGIKGTIEEIVPFGTGGCTDSTSGHTACTIVNENPEPSIIAFTSSDSGSPTDIHTTGSLVEGTVDLTAATGNPNLCIATSIVETRQSSSVSSILDDLTFSQAATCDVIVTVECHPDFDPAPVEFGPPAGWNYTVRGTVATTAGEIDDVKIERITPSPVTTIVDVPPGVDDVNVTPKSWGSHTFFSTANPVTVQVKASGSFGQVPVDDVAEVQCEGETLTGSLTVTKECIGCIADVGDLLAVRIKAAGEVENSDDDVPILSFDIVETAGGNAPTIVASFPGDFPAYAGQGPGGSDLPLLPSEKVSYSLEYDPSDLPDGDGTIELPDDVGFFQDEITIENIQLPLEFQLLEGTVVSATGMCTLCVDEPVGGFPFGLNCDEPPAE